MTMKKMPSLEQATEIMEAIAAKRKQFGRFYSLPYHQDTMLDAVQVVVDSGVFDRPSKEELTKAARQLTAANARYAKCRKALGKDVPEDDVTEVPEGA